MIATKGFVLLMLALTAIYVIGLGQRSAVLLMDPSLLAKLFGALIVLFPVLATWLLAAEIRFGFKAEALARQLISEGYPALELEHKPSGRSTSESAAAALDLTRTQAKQAPGDWRIWFRMAEAFDASGDRKSARSAARTAMRLEKSEL